MANAFTNLIPTVYAALDKVSRELVGFIPAVNRDSTAERAAVGQTITFHVPPVLSAVDIAPGQNGPNPADLTVGSDTMTISKSKAVQFFYTGEEVHGLATGPGKAPIFQGQMTQAFRTLVNELEGDLSGLASFASRAYAVGSGVVFDNTDQIGSIAQVRRILADNGAPVAGGDLHLVLDTNFAAKLRSLSVLYKANESGSDQMLREGALGRVHGMSIHESGGILPVAMYGATPSGLVVNGATAKGATDIALKTGTGAFKKGDIVTIGDDLSHRYVVSEDGTPTALKINEPGLVASVANGAAVAKVGALTGYTPLAAFSRNALTLVSRPPALPESGDMGEHHIVTDPLSGLSFDVARYPQYRREVWEVSLAWGVKATKREHLALIMGT